MTTTSSQTTRTATKTPAGWTRVAAGHYRHPETGTEIINTWGGRKVSGWWICVPPSNKDFIHEGAEGRCPIIHDCKNLAAAFAAAEPAIARIRAMIAQAWDDAQFEQVGRPLTWQHGHADEATVIARRAAVRATGTRTGRGAALGEFVIHIETGAIGTFSSYARSTHEGIYVYFPGEPLSTRVHVDDVVALNPATCSRRTHPDHEDHEQAQNPECFIEETMQAIVDRAHAEALEIHRRLMDSRPTLSGLRAVWADRPDVLAQLARFEGKCEPGARLWVYGYPWSFGVTVTGLVTNRLELIFGGCEADGGRRRFVAPLIAYRRDDTGETGTVGPAPAVTRGFASLLWTVLDADGLVIETGLDSVVKAQQVAAGHPGSTARLGLPTDRGYDVVADDGLGFADLDVNERYAADVARFRLAAEQRRLAEPARLPVACLRTEHYGMEINILGIWLTLTGVGPVDPETGDVELAAGGRSGTIAATVVVELRQGPGPDDTQTPDPDPDPASPPCADDADPGPDPAALGYRVQTQTDGRWHTVQTGPLPPTFPPVRSGLTAAAETILGNVGPVLGLGPRDRCPNVRVQTWHRPSGRTASTTRYA